MANTNQERGKKGRTSPEKNYYYEGNDNLNSDGEEEPERKRVVTQGV